MNTVEFIHYLQTLDVHIWSDGDRLRCEFDLRRRLAHGVPPGTTAH